GVTYCGESSASNLTMANVPWHEEVVHFVQQLANLLPDYDIACEHEHSNCILLAHHKFKVDGEWWTWIDYERFHELIQQYDKSGRTKTFTSLDYMAKTPSWAVFGARERGFDPSDTRFLRKNKTKDISGSFESDVGADLIRHHFQTVDITLKVFDCEFTASTITDFTISLFFSIVVREKMPFHHVTAGLLYKGNYLSRSLSEQSDSDQLASISAEELDEIREAFRVLDRDGNGFISKQELGMAMRSLGYMPSEVELAIIMQRLDMDGDGQVDFDEFMTILGPKLLSSETREGFLGNTIDSIFWQFDMQRITLEELKHILFHAFRDHLTMKDIENIIINEEESLNENSGNCHTEFEG
ncbi:calcium-binding protein 8 isoform X1, partial [Clarias magur]